MQDSKYSLPTLSMDKRRDELHDFTVDRVKEICGAKHIKVYGKTKDSLIKQLLGVEFPGEDYSRWREAVYHSPDGNGPADAAGPESLIRGTTEDAGRDHGKKSESSERDVECSPGW